MQNQTFKILGLIFIFTGACFAEPSAQVSEIVSRVGTFSDYSGLSGKDLDDHGVLQAFPAKTMLEQLIPNFEDNFEEQKRLVTFDLFSQDDSKMIKIDTRDEASSKFAGTRFLPKIKEAYGSACATISVRRLKELAQSTQIVVHPYCMPAQFFQRIQRDDFYSKMTPQEKRSFAEIEYGKGTKKIFAQPGVPITDQIPGLFNRAMRTPLLNLSPNVCVSMETIFFVEQSVDPKTGKAFAKLRNGGLSRATPVTLLAVPGINLAYGKCKNGRIYDGGGVDITEITVENMWTVCLESMKRRGIKYAFLPAIGLGAFAPEGREQKIAQIYFEKLAKLLSGRYRGCFDGIFFNPKKANSNLLDRIILKYKKTLDGTLINYDRDVMFAAIEVSKSGIVCALLDPSDADVVWGIFHPGEYFLYGHYAGEEHIGALSTACLSSRGVYKEGYTENVFEVDIKLKSARQGVLPTIFARIAKVFS